MNAMNRAMRIVLSGLAAVMTALGAWQLFSGQDATTSFLLAIICKLDARYD